MIRARVLVAVAVAAAMVAAPACGASVRLQRMAAARAPGFDQAGDNALLPAEGEETASEKKPFQLEDDQKMKDIEDALNNRDKLAAAEAAANAPTPADEEARLRAAAEKAERDARRPGWGKPCGKWDCSGKGLCFNGVCRCHENWHGDDCSAKYQDGEKRERREAPPAPETNAEGEETAGAAAKRQGLLNGDNEEATTPSERNALDLATTGKPTAAPVDKQAKAQKAADALGKGKAAPAKPAAEEKKAPVEEKKAEEKPAAAPATESLDQALEEEKKIEDANEKKAAA